LTTVTVSGDIDDSLEEIFEVLSLSPPPGVTGFYFVPKRQPSSAAGEGSAQGGTADGGVSQPPQESLDDDHVGRGAANERSLAGESADEGNPQHLQQDGSRGDRQVRGRRRLSIVTEGVAGLLT